MKRTRIAFTLAFIVLALTQMMCGCQPTPATTNVFAYQDLNDNGQYDKGEPPFPNIDLLYAGSHVPTDSNGSRVLKMEISPADCDTNQAVSATAPTGYTLSQALIPKSDCASISPFSYVELNRSVVFGFAPLAPTPQPQANATGTPPAVAAATATPAVAETPGLSITAISVDPGHFTGAKQKITFTYTFTNNGNVELDGPFDISDQAADPGTITCTQDPAIAKVAPQQSVTCTSSHVTTDADVSAAISGNSPVYEKIIVSVNYQSVTIQATQTTGAAYETPQPKEAQPTDTPIPQ